MIPRTLLLVASAFSERLPAERVAAALSEGLVARGQPEPDVLTLADGVELGDFDARMRRSRALVLALPRLAREDLPRSPAFELATRARQAGVPAYAVSAENALEAFDARILDLQAIFEARSPQALKAAGRKLAEIV